jgi:chemotaxis protein MotB
MVVLPKRYINEAAFPGTDALSEDVSLFPQWLTIFNDLVTLLMVFFVLLFSLGSIDHGRFKNFQNALQGAMGVLYEGRKPSAGVITAQGSRSGIAGQSGQIDASSLNAGLEAEYTPKGIQLILDESLMFSTGSAQLTAGGMQMLDKVNTIVKPLNRSVRVEGFTDNIPIATALYQSNWELSAARAVSVVKYMIEKGGFAPIRMSAAGYGDSRPRVANDSPANRARNRRVEIVLEPAKPGGQETVERYNGGE